MMFLELRAQGSSHMTIISMQRIVSLRGLIRTICRLVNSYGARADRKHQPSILCVQAYDDCPSASCIYWYGMAHQQHHRRSTDTFAFFLM